jgi:acyl-CoA synthetase (AMP-forming)/AMP-acid ligase II
MSLDAARSIALGEQLARIARKYPERDALVCGDTVRTYAQFDARVARLASGLAARGVTVGARLAVLMHNSLEMVETIFAGWRLGAIVVPINFRLVAAEVRFIVEDADPSAVVVDAALAHLVEFAAGPPAPPRAVIVHGEGAPLPAGAVAWPDLYSQAPGDFEPPIVSDAAPALICYTSGTTARPKGAVLSHFNLFMSTMNSMVVNGSGGCDEVWYSNLPLFHVGGLTGLLPQIISGGSSVIVPSLGFDPARAVADLERYGITACVFVGTQWEEICNQIVSQGVALRLRRVSWGTTSTPTEQLELMARTLPGVPVFCFFGQTEMSPVTCVLTGDDADRKRGSIGKPIINVEARLVDDKGHDVGPGEVGEIVYRGPTVMLGYWNLPEATAKAVEGGWFHSGDLCRADEEGYLYVVDRKTDMIISGGENIYCPEVEAAIASHPAVEEVAVIGVAHTKWGETPRAVIVPIDPERAPDVDELNAWCRTRLASYKKPTSVVAVGALPRNASGKVLKTVLRERYGQPAG